MGETRGARPTIASWSTTGAVLQAPSWSVVSPLRHRWLGQSAGAQRRTSLRVCLYVLRAADVRRVPRPTRDTQGTDESVLGGGSVTTTHMHGHHEATMGLAGVPGPRAQSSSSEPHCTGAPWHRLRSQSQSPRAYIQLQTAPSHNKWSAASRPSGLG